MSAGAKAGSPGAAGSAVLVCPQCRRPAIEDHNSFRCDYCQLLWPTGAGHELYVREVPCPDCYGGHFRPCNVCGDSGVALLCVESTNATGSATGAEQKETKP